MSNESDLLEDIDFHDIARSFAENRSCKKYWEIGPEFSIVWFVALKHVECG